MTTNFLPWKFIQDMDGAKSLDELKELIEELYGLNGWDAFNEALTPEEADEIVSQHRFSPRHFFRKKYGAKNLDGFVEQLYKKGGSELIDEFYALDSEDAFAAFLVNTLMSYHK